MGPENLDNSEEPRFPRSKVRTSQNWAVIPSTISMQSTGQVYVKADILEKNFRRRIPILSLSVCICWHEI
jgi:hypothetical protein